MCNWLLRKLNANLLSVNEVDRAFPLIRTICPAAELEGWRRFALQCLAAGPDSGTGVLVVRNEQDCIVGIAAFRLADDLVHGPVLVARSEERRVGKEGVSTGRSRGSPYP